MPVSLPILECEAPEGAPAVRRGHRDETGRPCVPRASRCMFGHAVRPRCPVAVCNWLGALVRKVDVTSRKVNPDQSPGGIWFAGRCVIGLGLATRHYRETRYWAWYLLRIYVTVKPNGVDKKHCQMM